MILARLCAAGALFSIPFAAFAGSMAGEQTVPMHAFADGSVIESTEAKLHRMPEGTYVTAKTHGLEPGHAVTMWWVVFNEPSLCSGGECGEDDVFNLDEKGGFILNADGSPPMNHEMIEKVGISALRADGRVIGAAGTATYKGFLPVGDDSDAAFGGGMQDPMKAEVHLVLRDHMVPSADKLSDALNTIHGGCDATWPNAPCEDVQFAVFAPVVPTN